MTCLSLGSKRKEDKLSWGEETGRWCRKSVGAHEERKIQGVGPEESCTQAANRPAAHFRGQ